MQNEGGEGKVAETKVSTNNSTSVPSAFRTNQNVGPDDRLVWRHETCEGGDKWVVEKKPEGK